MSKTLASSDFELGFPSFISSSLILVDIMIVLRVIGFRGRCMRNIQGNHCKNSFRTFYNNQKIDAAEKKVSMHISFLEACKSLSNVQKNSLYLMDYSKMLLNPIILQSTTFVPSHLGRENELSYNTTWWSIKLYEHENFIW